MVNIRGKQPIHSAEPLERLEAVHLAAAAPLLRHALAELVRRFDQVKGLTGVPNVDERFAQYAHAALIASTPVFSERMRVTEELELFAGLDEAAGVLGGERPHEVPGPSPEPRISVA